MIGRSRLNNSLLARSMRTGTNEIERKQARHYLYRGRWM